MNDGPFTQDFNNDLNGVVRRELITYRYKNGMLVKETAVRNYTSDDYTDSTSSTPLPELHNG